jgi:fimbrial chaperone protein
LPGEIVRRASKSALALLILVACAISGAAWAGSLQLTPLALTLTPQAPVGLFRIRNTGADSTYVHVQGFRWHQQGAEERLVRDHTLVASPPAFELTAGAAQTVRVGLIDVSPGTVEQAWRLFFQEVPDAQQTRPLEVALRLSVPVFLRPLDAEPQPLEWEARGLESGRIRLTVRNPGMVHHKLLAIRPLHVEQPLPGGPPYYLLPGSTWSWQLPLLTPGTDGLRLDIRDTEGVRRITLPLHAQRP